MANDHPSTSVDLVIGLLAFSSGAADVFSFLELHQIFTSAMTGNTALLGLAIGQGHLTAGVRSLAALAGFAAGCAIATLVFEIGKAPDPAIRRRLLLAFELLCLIAATLLWIFWPHPVLDADLYAQIGLWSVAMGTQSVNARKIDLPGINTVVFTSTLTMIIMGLTRTVLRRTVLRKQDRNGLKPRTARQIVMMLVYLTGAVSSGVLAFAFAPLMTLPPLIAVGAALVIAIFGQVRNRSEA